VFGNVVLAVLAASLTLVARSFAGGAVMSLVFVLVVDTAMRRTGQCAGTRSGRPWNESLR
jgi:hypothetical protein